jgi:hypothetical protein
LVRSRDPATIQQVLRVIINIAFDEHCRYQLQKADAAAVIQAATSQASDNTVFSLSSTALKNLSVPVPAAVQADVNHKHSSGHVEHISAPKASQQGKSEIDLKGLENVLGAYGSSGGAKKPTPAPHSHQAHSHTPQAHAHVQTHKPPPPKPVDDLDDLLDFQPTKKPEPVKSYTPPPPKPVAQPTPAASRGTGYDYDLDDLLHDVKPAAKPVSAPKSTPPPPKAAPKNDLDDIDDLLAGIDTSKKPPPKPAAHDDIDDLLADIEPHHHHKPAPVKSTPAKAPPKTDLDNIDDLLALCQHICF